jgi:photosystem II stability/assembly factor-like uncharacterized protein
MKNFLFYLFVLTSLSITAYTQEFNWKWQNPTPSGADQNDAVILSSSKFILFGNGSAVTISTDAGSTWSVTHIDPQARDIQAVRFVDQNIGYVVGSGGLVMKTTDGGDNWVAQTSGVTVTLFDVDFINANVGFAVGTAGNILKTTDGGNNWSVSNYGTTTIYKIQFVNDNLIYMGSASTSTGILLRSTNSGTSWDNITSNITGLNGTVRGLFFLNENTGWISNSTGKIYKTTDGGNSGGIVYDIGSTTTAIYSIKFVNANLGYAVTTAGRVLQSTNGGTNWVLTQTAATANLFSLALLGVNSEDATPALVGGDVGTIILSLDDGTSWQLKSSSVTNNILQRVSFPSEFVGFAVGGSIASGNSYGDILKTTNAGEVWTKLPLDPGYRAYSVFFLNENVGYVGSVGPNGIYKTTNGGDNWTQLNTGTGVASSNIYDIKFYDDNLGFAMYSSGQVARTSDGGNSWESISAGWGNAAGYEIFIVNSSVIYLCGGGNRVSKSTNGGLSFSQITSLGTVALYSMHFFDANNGFISGSSGKLYKTTNGGGSFTEIQMPTSTTLYSIRFVDDDYGYVGGEGGVFYYTTDGGDNWTNNQLYLGNSQSIRDIRFKGPNLWLVGTDGLIMKGTELSIPVELTSFTASVVDNSVILNWQTATETNNSGFEIQRLQDYKIEKLSEWIPSEQNWETIGFVPGFGTTTEIRSYSYTDAGLSSGTYLYRIKQIDYDGSYEYSNVVEVNVGVPEKFSLEQNYPNPFNPTTKIKFTIQQTDNPLLGGARGGFVTLKVYDILGTEITTLINEEKPAGNYEVEFDARGLSSGTYFYKLITGNFVSVKKMLLMK